MTDEERRIRRLEALVSGMLSKLFISFDITCHEASCTKCDGKGTWQDGGDCAICDGAGVTFEFFGGAP